MTAAGSIHVNLKTKILAPWLCGPSTSCTECEQLATPVMGNRPSTIIGREKHMRSSMWRRHTDSASCPNTFQPNEALAEILTSSRVQWIADLDNMPGVNLLKVCITQLPVISQTLYSMWTVALWSGPNTTTRTSVLDY